MPTEEELDVALEKASSSLGEKTNGADSPSDTNQDSPSSSAEGSQTPAGGDTPLDEKLDLSQFDEQSLRDLKEGKIIPKYRFDQINEKLKLYENLGDPATIAKAIAAWNQMQGYINSGKQSQSDSSQSLSEEDKQVIEYMRKLYPGLDKLNDLESLIERMRYQEEVRLERYLETARAKLSELAEKELGIKNKDSVAFIEEMINRAIMMNPEEHKKFVEGDIGAVERAFQIVKKSLVEPLKTSAVANFSKDKGKLKMLPKGPGQGGIPGTLSQSNKQQGKDISFDELHEHAFERLQEISSGR